MGKLPEDAAISSVETLVAPGSFARLHVARLEGGGFIVLSADDLVDPVIAFSPSGTGVDSNGDDPFWALLCGDIAAREVAAGIGREDSESDRKPVLRATRPNVGPSASQRKWAELLDEPSTGVRANRRSSPGTDTISEVRVEPFVESRWNQEGDGSISNNPCYNYYTPSNYPCGCVATVGAQIMRYWRWPQVPVDAGSRTWTCFVDGVATNLSIVGGVYDWDSMPLVPAHGTSEAERRAIGRITHDVGVSVGMDWTVLGSGANPFGLVVSFTDTFGFTNAVAAAFDPDHPCTLAELQSIVIPNCDFRAPVALGLSGENGGHAILVDGYGWSDGSFFLHVNFGWGGTLDAWYCPPDIYDFSVIEQAVFNVFPELAGSILSGRILDESGAPVEGAVVTLSQGAETLAETVSDANGLYALVSPACNGMVAVSKLGNSAFREVALGETRGVELVPGGVGQWYQGSYASIGNSWGNDIVIMGLESAPAPVFSPPSCLFYPSTNVTISCVDEGVDIRYTLDGSTPTENSPLYSGPYVATTGGAVNNGPIFVEDTVTIKARSFSPGKMPSPIVTATYTYDASAGPPRGDYFADPIVISGMSGSHVVRNNGAYTREDDEPQHTLDNNWWYPEYRTIWYQWTAPGSGTMTFETSTYDETAYHYSFVAVYTGDTIGSLQRLAYDTDDDCDFIASLSLSVEQGTTYRIVGMTYDEGSPCAFTLTWSGNLEVRTSPYEAWAREQTVYPGGPAEKTGGVENAFRYAFGIPSEPFSPILSVSMDASGRPVLAFPPVLNTNGVTLTLLSTTNLTDWSSAAVSERPLVLDGDGTMRPGDSDAVRFYRLKARVSP